MLKGIKQLLKIHNDDIKCIKEDLKTNDINSMQYLEELIDFFECTTKHLEDIRQYEINK